jgi:hypothetical protein
MEINRKILKQVYNDPAINLCIALLLLILSEYIPIGIIVTVVILQAFYLKFWR